MSEIQRDPHAKSSPAPRARASERYAEHRRSTSLSAAERRDLANALLRAAWSAVLEDTRIVLLDLLVEVDDTVLESPRDEALPDARDCR